MSMQDFLTIVSHHLWSLPVIVGIAGISLFLTVALNWVQFRYFFTSWAAVFTGGKSDIEQVIEPSESMSTFQAFLNVLGAGLGNGSVAGVATAIVLGGPGAAFWLAVFGILSMSLRFAEVYLGTCFVNQSGDVLGGPMLYLSKIPGGRIWPAVYAFLCLLYGFSSGNAMQCNAVRYGISRLFSFNIYGIAIAITLFTAYIVFGGARRIIAVSDFLVPVKVFVFFVSAIIVMGYHWDQLIPALKLIMASAFGPAAFGGGLLGFTLQGAIRHGVARSFNATESGLGLAAVLFGSTGSRDAMRNGFMGMVTTFISSQLVCFTIAWIIIASGVWNNGQTSLDLTISSYETVFGALAGWIVTFLSVSFGLGCVVTYAYISRECWIFLTGGRFMLLFSCLYCVLSGLGVIADVTVVFNVIDIVNMSLLVLNVFGLLYLLPTVRQGVRAYHDARVQRHTLGIE